ncbi:MAG: DUF1684 domain-containing protein [Proteobacteria bacterium]|nr:DUF1684 domain-containing protein [Pseudomonadota bacterium]
MKIAIIMLLFSFNSMANDWQSEIENWKQQRVSNLTKPHGWLSLIDMEWFRNGDNSIGSALENDIVLPSGPKHIGNFHLLKDKITFTPNKEVNILANEQPIKATIEVKMDSSGEQTVFSIDTFQFYVIQRGKPALRIKDSLAKTLQEFKGISYFPMNEEYKVEAEFVPYESVKEIEIINILGMLNKEKSFGKLKFQIKGNTYYLDTLDSGDNFFILFADRTSGRASYGPGRFLYVPKPKQGNMTSIDFNMAYNPPCAFNDYSTCPLPPAQNRLKVYVEAGEKKYHK